MRNKKVCRVVYYESTKPELQTEPIYVCQCDERLKTDMQVDRRKTQPRNRLDQFIDGTSILFQLEILLGYFIDFLLSFSLTKIKK